MSCTFLNQWDVLLTSNWVKNTYEYSTCIARVLVPFSSKIENNKNENTINKLNSDVDIYFYAQKTLYTLKIVDDVI